MLYLSELNGKRVVTDNGTKLGRLTDLVFLAADQPMVTKLVVLGRDKQAHTIPTRFLKSINRVITIAAHFEEAGIVENELFVNVNLQDQQIIDVSGNKVVRVNDVVLQDKPARIATQSVAGGPQLLVAGGDIGLLGILRWFGADETIGKLLRNLNIAVTSRFLSWADIQPLELTRGTVVMKQESQKLKKLLPEDLADHLEQMNVENVQHILELLSEPQAAEVIENLNISFQSSLFKQFYPKKAANIIERIDPDEAIDILLTLQEKKRTDIMAELSREKKAELTRLLKFAKTPIGDLITSEFLTVSPEDTVQKIKSIIKTKTRDFSTLHSVYAVNKTGQLVGVANLHELLQQDNDTLLYRFMIPSVVIIHLETPVEIAIKKMLKYKVDTLPVVDERKQPIGIVTFDDLAGEMLKKFA